MDICGQTVFHCFASAYIQLNNSVLRLIKSFTGRRGEKLGERQTVMERDNFSVGFCGFCTLIAHNLD